MSSKRPWDQYGEYLSVDKILNAQNLRSNAAGDPIHDEMLFIQFHQIYELWFKQVLFELDDIQARFSSNIVDDSDMHPILVYMGRITEIFKQMESMVDVLETMPPQSFTDFRDYLESGSGFQSLQFRLIEVRLGLRRDDRFPVFHGQFDDHLREESRKAISAAEKKETLYDQIEHWLERTPFIEQSGYEFWNSYREAVYKMFDEKIKIANAALSGDDLEKELKSLARGKEKFDGIFDPEKHKKAQKDGHWRMSLRALQAALFITIYREEPVLQAPYKLLNSIMDIDALLGRWRYRHALMVQRMTGMSLGTGGSSGYDYLMKTVVEHRIFTDFFGLSTYLIPSRERPPLPQNISDEMRFKYSTGT